MIGSSISNLFGVRTLRVCCALALVAGSQVPASGVSEPQGVELPRQQIAAVPLPADPSVVRGRLGNGLRFAIAPMPAGDGDRNSVSFVLQIASGSAFERDDQIGAAKLASEIASRGEFTSDPEGFRRVVESFDDSRRSGLRAYSTFDTTRFILTVPLEHGESLSSADLGRIADALARLIDAPGGEVTEGELGRARRDLLAQQTRWSGPSQRISARSLPVLFGDSVFADRVPIYAPADLEATTPEAVGAFARDWYAPGNATLVVSGPVEPKVVQRAIEVAFGRIEPGDQPEVPELAIGEAASSVLVETDPAIASDIVQLMVIAPPGPRMDSEAALRDRLAERVVIEAINRRLQDLSRRDGTAALQAGAFSQPNAGGFRMSMVNVVGASGGWAKLTREAIASINSVQQIGFDGAERTEAIERVRASLEAEASASSRWSSGRVASGIADRMRHSETITSAEQMSRLGISLLPTLRAADLERAADRLFEPERLSTIIVTAGAPPTEQQVRHQIATAMAIDPVAVARATPLPKPRPLVEGPLDGGDVIDLTHDASTGVTSATLSNGVRMHHRHMADPERPERVEISVAILGGRSEQCVETRGLTDAIEALEWQPATRQHSGSEVAASIEGHDIDFRVDVHPESVTFEISTRADEFEIAMRLLHVLLRDGVIETAAFDRWRVFETQATASARTEPAQVALTLYETHVTPDLAERGASLTAKDLERLNADDVNAWLKRLTSSGALTASIVGEIERDTALRIGAQSLGGLPDRSIASSSRLASPRPLRYPGEMLRMTSEASLAAPTSAVVVGFRSADRWDVADAVALDVASEVLEGRMRQRIDEHPAFAASVSVWNLDGEYYAGTGRFWARALVAPADVEAARELLASELDRLVETGPTPEEVARARRSIIERSQRRENSARSWAEALSRDGALDGQSLRVLRDRPEAARTVTPDQIRDALARYSVPERSFEITVLPRGE